MAEIYGRETGLCKGYGGSMHLTDVERGFLGTSGIVAPGDPPCGRRGLGGADPRARDRWRSRSSATARRKQGAFMQTLSNIARARKALVVFVMENNSYNVHTRVEQEHANAAAGEPLAVKAQAYSMPGVTVDGGDPVAVYEQVSAAVGRARSGDGPTLVESRVYRLSAHGNIIAPPGVPLHYPGARGDRGLRQRRGVRGCEARRSRAPLPGAARHRGDAFRGGGGRDRRGCAEGDPGGRRLRARESVSGTREGSRVRLRVRPRRNRDHGT